MNRFQSWYNLQPRAIRALLTINVVIYVLWHFPLGLFPPVQGFVWNHLALNPGLPGILLEPWQMITYSFLHLGGGLNGLLHVAFNMLWLFWIGKEYEELHGPHRLLSAYVFGAVGGALLTVLLHAILPGVGPFGGVVHGASGAVLGVMTTVAIRYPYKSVALIFLPPIRLIYLVIGFLVIDLLLMTGDVSVSAHMGGALFGFLLARAESSGMDLSSWAGVFFGGRSSGGGARGYARQGGKEDMGLFSRIDRWMRSEDEPEPRGGGPARIHPFRRSSSEPEEPNDEDDVDRILDKISAHGYEALTDEEKRILYEASKR